ncbi:MAG: type II toxin-antitoxin system Phd/YefM family antitoxin [Kiritimatiellae bacterium]|nr:type II toxin-antitoxin system Phd/YefM family antitoxin [Kiritimatiellia bacterium]
MSSSTRTKTKKSPRKATQTAVPSADRPGIRRPILSEDIISFTECRGKLGEYIEKTRRTHRPIIVTQNGKPTSVLVSVIDWEASSPNWEEEQRIAEQVLDDMRIAEGQFANGECHSNKDAFSMVRKEFGL